MDDDRGGKTASRKVPGEELSDEQAKRSVVISNIPSGTEPDKLYIHFQKNSNGGGEIEKLAMLGDGTAILTYEEVKVAESVLQKEQKFGGAVLQLQPCTKKEVDLGEIDVFSLVSAKINPTLFDMTPEQMNGVLSKIAEETKVQYIELCDGYWVSGSYKQINKTCSKLSSLVATKGAHSNDVSSNGYDDMHQNESRQQGCEPVVLDVQQKLIYILRKHIKDIEEKYKIKIDYKTNQDKATLSPLDDEESFEAGKEEFITLYQKAFQQMDEKSFSLDSDETKIKKLSKELMEQLDVVIEHKNKMVCIYGRDEHVGKAMHQLQGKPKRSARKACKPSPDNDVLPKPDTFAQLSKVLTHQLENGVTVTVCQGDITQQKVDVIVNAANERLEHGGGVAGAIVKYGGFQIQQESRQIVQQYGRVPVGQVANTGPGHLPCRGIIHAVGPEWKVHGPEGSRQLISNACLNSFCLASQWGARSIVLPAISSGIFGVPKEVCAEVLFSAAEMFSCETTSQNQLRDIRFVNIDSPTNDAFRREFYRRYVEKQTNNRELATGTPSGNEPATAVNPSGYDKKPEDGKRKPTDNNPSSSNKTPTKPALSNDKTKTSYAAAAAMKRAEQNKTNVEHETLPQNPAKVNSPAAFQTGFENRQTNTRRDDTNKDVKGKGNTPTDKINKATSSTTDSRKSEERHSGTDSQPTPNPKLESSAKPSDSSIETEVTPPLTEGNTNHKVTKTVKDDSTVKTISDDNASSGNTSDFSKVRGKGKGTNQHRPDSSELKKAGRGRGAIAHQSTNTPSIAANFPGRAERVESTSRKPNVYSDNKNNVTLSDAPSEEETRPGQKKESSLSDQPTPRPSEMQSPEAPDRSEKTTGLEVNEEGQSLPGENDKHPPEQSAGLQPPGLEVTKEGLNFAATCKLEDKTPASLPQDVSTEKDTTSMKRKFEEESSERSPKLRKEDEEKPGKLSDEKKQNIDDSSTKSLELREEGEGETAAVSDEKDKHKEDSQDLSKITQELQKEGKGETLVASDEEEQTKQDASQKQRSDSGENTHNTKKEVDGKDTNQKDEERLLSEQQPPRPVDEIASDEVEVLSTNTESVNTNVHEEKSPPEPHLDPKDNSKDVGDKVKDIEKTKDEDGKECRKEGAEVKIDNEGKDNNEIRPVGQDDVCNADEKGEMSTTHVNDLDRTDEQPAVQDSSLSSYVVLDPNIVNSQGSKDRKRISEGSSSSESIVNIDGPDEGETNDEIQADNSSTSKPINIDNNESEKPKTEAIDDKEGKVNANQVSPETEKESESSTEYATKKNDNIGRKTNESTSDSTMATQTEETKPIEKETPFEIKNQQEVENTLKDESGNAADVDDLTQMLKGFKLSTTDDNTGNKDKQVHKTDPIHTVEDECGLCKTAFSDDKPRVILSGCGHVICEDCKVKFEGLGICPTCEKKAGCNVLQPPNGRMTTGTLDLSVPGFDDNKTIYIDYWFPGGIQGSCHPRPGHRYDSLEKRRTFLPDTPEGQDVLDLLHKALDAGLLFTVGECTIANGPAKDDQVIFSDLMEHKFNLGGLSTHGYPDPDYLGRVKEQLQRALENQSSSPSTEV